MLKLVAMMAIAIGLVCPAQAQRLASEDIMVPLGDGAQIFVRNKRPEAHHDV